LAAFYFVDPTIRLRADKYFNINFLQETPYKIDFSQKQAISHP